MFRIWLFRYASAKSILLGFILLDTSKFCSLFLARTFKSYLLQLHTCRKESFFCLCLLAVFLQMKKLRGLLLKPFTGVPIIANHSQLLSRIVPLRCQKAELSTIQILLLQNVSYFQFWRSKKLRFHDSPYAWIAIIFFVFLTVNFYRTKLLVVWPTFFDLTDWHRYF